MLIMDSAIIPRPPAMPPAPPIAPPPPPSFRLLDDKDDTTGSIYSIYKQKIDAMFEADEAPPTPPPHPPVSRKNSVQARIEKMFTDIAKDGGEPALDGGAHTFSIDYLGSVPLNDKVQSLVGLQSPLRALYFSYKKGLGRAKSGGLSGRLQISHQGLKVRHQQDDKGDFEQMNSFPTIAVWSAVKFVVQKETCAFLPLITDPDNIDKRTLFRALNAAEMRYIGGGVVHSPLFAVVMRKFGVQRQLECHGFVCQTSEDAIVIAATLYKALMAHMKAKEMKPKSRNGIHCMSIASSVGERGGSEVVRPVRPPRQKKRSVASSVASDEVLDQISDTQPLLLKSGPLSKKSVKVRRAPPTPEEFDAILPYEDPVTLIQQEIVENCEPIQKPKSFSDKINTFMSREQKQITAEIKQVMSEGINRGLKPVEQQEKLKQPQQQQEQHDEIKEAVESLGKSSGMTSSGTLRQKDNTGDILTKVTIPRSGSFLNAGGLTRYKSKISRSNGQASGGSPLGFNELFNEFRLQEGLHSMDEILGVIIDPDGMSFNDLKPIYKEFLLKLSVTLTKDELYHRSKTIMRRQQKKKRLHQQQKLKQQQQQQHKHKRRFRIAAKFKRFKRIFKTTTKKKTTVIVKATKPNPPESSISTSSYDTRQFTPKTAPPKAANGRKNASTSEESDFFSVRRKMAPLNGVHVHRNSSSGYVSCSECSYDSDTCTCTSADKCYCSLGNPKHLAKRMMMKEAVGCDCDTDSCAESNKCYCQVRANASALYGSGGGGGTRHKRLCKRASNTKSTQSMEYVPNPDVETYYEKLRSVQEEESRRKRRRSREGDTMALDYQLFRRMQQQHAYEAILGEEKMRLAKYSTSSRSGRDVHSMTSGVCTEALSVKKSAEIAALFADIKLTHQGADFGHLKRRAADAILSSSRNAYNRLKNDISPPIHHYNMVQNGRTCIAPETASIRYRVNRTNRGGRASATKKAD